MGIQPGILNGNRGLRSKGRKQILVIPREDGAVFLVNHLDHPNDMVFHLQRDHQHRAGDKTRLLVVL